MNPNDPDVIDLSKAIIQRESGGNFNAVGDAGTSHGAGQWQAATWKSQAKDVLGDENAQMTPANQKAVIQVTVAKRKAAGLNPAQIAAEWNSGSSKGWENKIGTTTINGQKIHYDVPAYVKAVTDLYQKNKASRGGSTSGYNPAPYSNPTNPGLVDFSGGQTTQTQSNQPHTFLGDVGQDFNDAGANIANVAAKTTSGQINPLSGALQTAGAAVGGFNALTNTALEHIPVLGGAVKGLEGLIGRGVGALANTGVGKSVVDNYQSLPDEWKGNLGAVGNIATAVPIFKGLNIAKGAVKGAVGRTIGSATDAVAETIAPKLTAKETAQAITQRGTSKKGLLRTTVLNEDPKIKEIADVIKKNVPKFNPSKPLLHNIVETQNVVSQMARDLKRQVIKGGEDRIYSFKELQSKLNSIERPLLIASDTNLNNAYKRVIAKAVEIAKTKGGKVSNLLDARQEFDSFVKKQFPNLYSSDTLTPMRSAIKDIRNTITDFTAENLPADIGLKQSLLTQHQLINAIENMAEKASSGQAKEIGTNALTRLGDKHPLIKGLITKGGRAVAEGAGFGAVTRLIP